MNQAPQTQQDPSQNTNPDVPDEIERSVFIAADAKTVFDIVSEPGWFINNGTYVEHEIELNGDTARVTDPTHGPFEVGIVSLEPPHRAVFRWLGGAAGSLDEFPSNTVEFLISPEGDGVRLTVIERGFAGLTPDAVVRRRRFEDNSEGWKVELDVARGLAEDRVAARH